MSSTGIRPRSAAASSGAPASHAGRLRRVIGSAWQPCGPSTTTSCGASPSGAPTWTTCSRAAGPLYAAARLLSRAGLESLSWGQSPEFHGVLLHEARRADVIHGYWLGGPHAVAAWLAARVARRPFVLTPFFHEGFAHHETRVAHALLRGADRVIALTEFEASALEARGARPNRVVHGSNAIDAPRPAPAARTRVRAEPRGANIIDLPALSCPAKFALLAAADVLVLPSRHESFGTVFLEAWA